MRRCTKQKGWPLVTVAPVAQELYRYIIGERKLPPDDTAEVIPEVVGEPYIEPSFDEIREVIAAAGMRMDDQTLRRYHLALKTRGFVILSGLSGAGKTWLARLYAEAVGAECEVVPVAPTGRLTKICLASGIRSMPPTKTHASATFCGEPPLSTQWLKQPTVDPSHFT